MHSARNETSRKEIGRRRAGRVALFALSLPLLCAIPAQAERLNSPFGHQPALLLDEPVAPCPTPPPAIVDIMGVAFYTDDKFSIPDPAKEEANRKAIKPLYEINNAVIAQTDAFIASGRKNVVAAACALGLMEDWARKAAMTGKTNSQGLAHRAWTLNALAIDFLLIRDEPTLDPKAVKTVAKWLGDLGWLVTKTHANAKNNHLYWGAAAVAGAAISADDLKLFEWAMTVARQGTADIDAKGALPLEIARGRRAMMYLVFSLSAQVLLAEYGEANGVALYAQDDRAIQRLAAFVIRNLEDPTEVAQLAGFKQEWKGISPPILVWAEPLYARFRNPQLAELLRANRPIRLFLLGGNVTAMSGIPLD